ncbi:hypothetical protein BRC86_03805 [Halobacteriales archaeon QS_3_64_16]|nr:MAG: hypothetical protein BRC86_03805 [Halobacteriales archaeon QS_3_64_16]
MGTHHDQITVLLVGVCENRLGGRVVLDDRLAGLDADGFRTLDGASGRVPSVRTLLLADHPRTDPSSLAVGVDHVEYLEDGIVARGGIDREPAACRSTGTPDDRCLHGRGTHRIYIRSPSITVYGSDSHRKDSQRPPR